MSGLEKALKKIVPPPAKPEASTTQSETKKDTPDEVPRVTPLALGTKKMAQSSFFAAFAQDVPTNTEEDEEFKRKRLLFEAAASKAPAKRQFASTPGAVKQAGAAAAAAAAKKAIAKGVATPKSPPKTPIASIPKASAKSPTKSSATEAVSPRSPNPHDSSPSETITSQQSSADMNVNATEQDQQTTHDSTQAESQQINSPPSEQNTSAPYVASEEKEATSSADTTKEPETTDTVEETGTNEPTIDSGAADTAKETATTDTTEEIETADATNETHTVDTPEETTSANTDDTTSDAPASTETIEIASSSNAAEAVSSSDTASTEATHNTDAESTTKTDPDATTTTTSTSDPSDSVSKTESSEEEQKSSSTTEHESLKYHSTPFTSPRQSDADQSDHVAAEISDFTTDGDITEDDYNRPMPSLTTDEESLVASSGPKVDVGSDDESDSDAASAPSSPVLSRSSSGASIKTAEASQSSADSIADSLAASPRLFASTPVLKVSRDKVSRKHSDAKETPSKHAESPIAPRVFVFDPATNHGVAVTIKSTWGMSDFLEACSQKLGVPVKRVFYKNGAEVTSLSDLRENDELQVSLQIPDSPTLSKKSRKFERRNKQTGSGSSSPLSSSPDSPSSRTLGKKKTSRSDLGKKPKRSTSRSELKKASINSSSSTSSSSSKKKHKPLSPAKAMPEKRLSAAEWAASLKNDSGRKPNRRRLSRSDSDTEAKLMLLEQQRKEALARIAAKKYSSHSSSSQQSSDSSLSASMDSQTINAELEKKTTVAANLLPGTRIKRQHLVDANTIMREMRRSKSEPDISLLSSLPRLVVTRPRSHTTQETIPVKIERRWRTTPSGYSSTDNTSTLSSTDTADISDNEDAEELQDASPFDLVDEGKEINPLTISDEEVWKRMMIEEKEDLENILVHEETGQVKAGTLRALTRRLNSHLHETEFVDAFLLTYDFFIDPVTLLKSLIMLFRAPFTTENGINDMPVRATSRSASPGSSSPMDSPAPRRLVRRESQSHVVSPQVQAERQRLVIQYRIIVIIKKWIEWRYEKVSKRKSWVSLLKEFAAWLDKSDHEKMKSWSVMLLKALKDARRRHANLVKQLERLSVSNIPASKTGLPYKRFIDIPPEEFAKQLTLMEQEDFAKITISEYSHLNFSKPDKMERAPHVVKMIKRFNDMSYWVATTIIRAEGTDQSPKQRAQIITNFITVMEILLQLKNYNSALQIFSALNISSISRLQKTWSYVPQKAKAAMEEVNKLFFAGGPNNKLYREQLEFAEPPCIPLQDVFCRDLTFIEENPTVLENGWINFEKMLLLGKTFKHLKRLQSVQYDFPVVPAIIQYINSQEIMSESELFEKSKVLEPSETQKAQQEKEKQEERDKLKAEKKKEKEEKKAAKKNNRKSSLANKDKVVAGELTLERVLADKELFASFSRFMQSIHADECLEFYKVVSHEYKTLDFSNQSPENVAKIKDVALKIVNTFISIDGEKALSTSDTMRQTVERAVRSGKGPLTDKIFDSIIGEVTFQLRSHFNSFRKNFEASKKR